jgi:hypothetical protein
VGQDGLDHVRVTFGPYDALSSVAGMLFILGGLGRSRCCGRHPAASRPSRPQPPRPTCPYPARTVGRPLLPGRRLLQRLVDEHRKAQLRLRPKAGNAWQDNDLVFCQRDGTPWNPDHVSKRFKKLAALAGVPVITLHEGGRHTGDSLMQDAGVDQELRMREVGHADKSVNDRYTHPLEQAHLAAAEQTAALVRKARKAA